MTKVLRTIKFDLEIQEPVKEVIIYVHNNK